MELEEREQSTCDVYQSWINWNYKKGTSSKTLKVYFSLLKPYVHYRGIKISDKEIKDNVNLPKIIKEQKEPLTIQKIHDILKIAGFDKKSLYLCLLSSGMRIGDAVQIKKCDTNIKWQTGNKNSCKNNQNKDWQKSSKTCENHILLTGIITDLT